MLPRLVQLAAATPSPEARRAVGEVSAVLLALVLLSLVVLCALALIYLRRRARFRADAEARRAAPATAPDAWSESSRRMPLEDDASIPREPGTE